MTGASRFGDFVLLKKLDEDALGEIYRAGEMNGSTLVRIVLLRLYSGHGIDGEALAAVMSSRANVLTAAPGLAPARLCGMIQGLAYAAYDYVSGRDLPSLLRRANDGFSNLAIEHAVLAVERIAKGLALIHGGATGQPSAHGFVCPQLVWVSNEGEARLLGYEGGPALARLAAAGPLDARFAAYASPRILAGGEPTPADDVYALGILLYELLTGAAPVSRDLSDTLIERAVLVADQRPLPPGLADLIRRSLAPPASRLADAGQWHEILSRYMSEAEVSATHFDFAFFMHELYRDEIHREDDELAREKTEAIQTAAVPVEPPASAAVVVPAAELPAVEPPPRGRGALPWVALAAALVLAAGAAWWLGFRAPPPAAPAIAERAPPPPAGVGTLSDEPPATPAADVDPGTVDPSMVEPVDPGAVESGDTVDPVPPADAPAELSRLIEERAAALSAQLSAEYDAEIKTLERQLEQARAAEAAADEGLAELPPSPPPVVAESPPPSATPPPPPTPPPPAAAGSSASTPPPPVDTGTPSTPPPPVDTGTPSTPPPPSTEGSPPSEASAPSPPPTTLVPPRLIDRPQPSYPPAARRVRKAATVVVKVLVGTDGRVEQAELASKRVGFGIDEAALAAAREARYQPAKVDGVVTAQWTTLVMRFEP